MTKSMDSECQRSILVTGASRGIGLAVARALSPVSDDLALVASSVESFDPVRREFEHAKFYGADFSSTPALRNLAEQLAAQHEHFDVVVNNCGLFLEKPFIESELPELEKIIDVNVKAPITLTRLLLSQIRNGSNSIVVNISSIQAKAKDKNMSVYAASKAALTAFSDALRKELNPLGIRVSVLQPAGVNTWGEQNPKQLLAPEEIGTLVKQIVLQLPNCQIEEITLSAI